MKNLSCIAVLLIAFVHSPFVLSQKKNEPVSFPSTQSRLDSPDGRFVILNVDADAEPHHTLYLEERTAKSRRKLMEYGRHVEILWSPTSTMFVITDYSGSDTSECFLYRTNSENFRENITDRIKGSIAGPKDMEALKRNDHIYFAAVRWTTPQSIRIKAWGQGEANPSGFIRYFEYPVKENIHW